MRPPLLRPFLAPSLAAVLIGSSQPIGVTITFLANEGVVLSSSDRQVLIDGLFRHYGDEFHLPADSTRVALERAAGPFRDVDLVLVTHRHGDHFHPASVASHLMANPGALLLTSQQVIDSLRGSLPAGHRLESRLLARTQPPLRKAQETVNGIRVELLGLPHGGRQRNVVEHLGYVVDIGGRRVLHVGDTDISEATFAAFRLDTARIDVALLPDWMVASTEGRRVIERWIKPRHVVAFHVPVDGLTGAADKARRALPGAMAFTRSLESRTF